jgi:hypothetical protein
MGTPDLFYDEAVKCFACGAETWLRGEIENHHFPTLKVDGGDKTIPLCRECHTLIERIPLGDWPIQLSGYVMNPDLPRPIKLLFLKVWKIAENSEYEQRKKA